MFPNSRDHFLVGRRYPLSSISWPHPALSALRIVDDLKRINEKMQASFKSLAGMMTEVKMNGWDKIQNDDPRLGPFPRLQYFINIYIYDFLLLPRIFVLQFFLPIQVSMLAILNCLG